MARTIKVVYENGVFRPLEPIKLEEGQQLDLYIPHEPGRPSNEEYEKALQGLHAEFAKMSEEELAEWDRDVLGPERLALRNEPKDKQ